MEMLLYFIKDAYACSVVQNIGRTTGVRKKKKIPVNLFQKGTLINILSPD